MRSSFSGAVLALVLITVLAEPAPARADPTDLGSGLASATSAVAGKVSVLVVDLETGYVFVRDPDLSFEAASLFKLFVMEDLFRLADDDSGVLDRVVLVDRPQLVDDRIEMVAVAESARDALADMIDRSDNEATQALATLLGIDGLNDSIRSLGLGETVVRSAEASGNTTSARDVGSFLGLLARRELVSPQASDAMIEVLSRQEINDRLSRGIPATARFAHKTGNSGLAVHDAGIVWSPWGARIVVVLTEDLDAGATAALMKDVGFCAYWLPAP